MKKDKSLQKSQNFQTWEKIKAMYQTAIVLIRVGEYYYTFGEDAVEASKILGIKIFNKQDNQQCRMLFNKLDRVLSKLVKAGHRVAVCDQL